MAAHFAIFEQGRCDGCQQERPPLAYFMRGSVKLCAMVLCRSCLQEAVDDLAARDLPAALPGRVGADSPTGDAL